MSDETDCAAWSRDAVTLMQERNARWIERFGVARAPYDWDLEHATIAFARGSDRVVADVCLVGTASASTGTFLWAWANNVVPAAATRRLDEVRAFGERHALALLTDAEWPGGRADGLEALAVAGRVLDAEGAWVDESGDLTLFMLLFRLRVEPSSA